MSTQPICKRVYAGDTDLENSVAEAVLYLRSTKTHIIRWEDLLDYYAQDISGIESILADCRKEMRDMMISVGQCTRSIDLKNLSISLHRILGMARYLFADRLVDISHSYITCVSHATKYASRFTEEDVSRMAVSFNMLLQQVVMLTTEAFSGLAVELLRYQEAKNDDLFLSKGMQRISTDSTMNGTVESDATTACSYGDDSIKSYENK